MVLSLAQTILFDKLLWQLGHLISLFGVVIHSITHFVWIFFWQQSNINVLFSKLAHVYTTCKYSDDNLNKKLDPGLIIDDNVYSSHFWFGSANQTYTHICLLKDWLT